MARKNNLSQKESTMRSSLMQSLICLVANIPTLPGGMTLGFSAIALPYMKTPNSELYITENEASFVASCVSLVIPIGSLVCGVLMEAYGRRSALLVSCIPAALGWLTMAFFPSLSGVTIGRLLTGFATGFCCTCSTILIAEGSKKNIRGFLVNGTNLSFASGIFIVYILGYIYEENWRMVAGLCGLVPLLSVFCVVMWLPESPVWLASRGRSIEAAKSLAKFRATHFESPSINAELKNIIKHSSSTSKNSSRSTLAAFARPETYKPFIIMIIFFFFQQFTGSFVIIFYGMDIVKEAGITIDGYVAAIVMRVTNVVFTVVGAWASLRFGRRPCTIFSGSGMTLSLFILVIYLHYTLPSSSNLIAPQIINNTHVLNSTFGLEITENITISDHLSSASHSWIPALALLAHVLTSTIGFLGLPWAMLGEVFPANVRGMASGFSTCLAYLFNFVIIHLYQSMLVAMGRKGLFFFYGAISFLATIFVAVFLPETQGKTLAQIEEYFAGHRRRASEEVETLKQEEIKQHNITLQDVNSRTNSISEVIKK